tara:strand:+ start:248 stop:619 length:372 start_codon:yes stop_codon:yes gene_type:complete
MNFNKTLFAFFILASVVACSSTKTKEGSSEASTTTTTTTTTNDDKMVNEGFIKGTIVFSDKPDDCAYTIQLEGKDGLMYDPMNLDVKYQKHDEKIWFTFSGLRRMNRCVKANPINITDIKKRT